MKILNIILTIVASVLQIGDGITTWKVLQRPDRKEANGLLATLFTKIGVLPGLLLAKGVGIAVCLIAYFFAGEYAVWVLLAITAGYSWILINNLRLL